MKPRKKVCGVGINDVNYVVQKLETIGYVGGKQKQKRVWICPYYQTWRNMLERCYSDRFQKHRPTYKGCTVSEDWLTLSKFRAWMEKQDFEGKHLDKDLLFEDNKIYSAETCVFVTLLVNNFILDSGAAKGERLAGAHWCKNRRKFQSLCRNPFTKVREFLGYFTTEQEAHQAWLKRKSELAHELAAIQENPRVAKALIDRHSKPCTG